MSAAMEPGLPMLAFSVLTTILGTLVGWAMNGAKNKGSQLKEKTEQEREEREENRKMLGELLYYQLEDLHRRYVVEGEACSAADKQRVEAVYRHYHGVLGLNGPGERMYLEIMGADSKGATK